MSYHFLNGPPSQSHFATVSKKAATTQVDGHWTQPSSGPPVWVPPSTGSDAVARAAADAAAIAAAQANAVYQAAAARDAAEAALRADAEAGAGGISLPLVLGAAGLVAFLVLRGRK